MTNQGKGTTSFKAKHWLLGIILAACGLGVFFGNPLAAQAQRLTSIQQAQEVVKQAWDIYHEAALSGTLASPQTQLQIENQLHRIRHLLAEAREAADQHDALRVNQLFTKIEHLALDIISASQESKK